MSRLFGFSPGRRRRIAIIAAVLAVAALSVMDHAGVFGYHPDDLGRFHGMTATVVSASDGVTIDIDVPDHGEPTTRIRLRGVECPENACEAGEFVRETVVRRSVRLELDPNRAARDPSGHVAAYVYLSADGRMVNELLLERGLARADGRFQHIYQDRFDRLEKAARRRRAGLWAGVAGEQGRASREHMDSASPP